LKFDFIEIIADWANEEGISFEATEKLSKKLLGD